MLMSWTLVLNFLHSDNWVSEWRLHMQIRSALCFRHAGNLNSAGNLNITKADYFSGHHKSVLQEIYSARRDILFISQS